MQKVLFLSLTRILSIQGNIPASVASNDEIFDFLSGICHKKVKELHYHHFFFRPCTIEISS